MHTIGHALEQNREVFAVPGPWNAPGCEGTNRLIQEGAAKLIMSGEDVLCELIDRFPGKLKRLPPLTSEEVVQRVSDVVDTVAAKKPAEEKTVDIPPAEDYIDWIECKNGLTDDQQTVMLALAGQKALLADEIVERTQLPARRVLSALTILQVQGYAAEESGKRFRLSVRLKME